MNPKHEALKQTIKNRLEESRHIDTPREKQIKERNSGIRGVKLVAKARHERRHERGEKTTKSQALEREKMMSKDYGKIRQ